MNVPYAIATTILLVLVILYKLESTLKNGIKNDYSRPEITYIEPDYDSPVRETHDAPGKTPTILRLGAKIENGPINYCAYRCNIMQMERAPEFIVQNADAVVLDRARLDDKISGLKEGSLRIAVSDQYCKNDIKNVYFETTGSIYTVRRDIKTFQIQSRQRKLDKNPSDSDLFQKIQTIKAASRESIFHSHPAASEFPKILLQNCQDYTVNQLHQRLENEGLEVDCRGDDEDLPDELDENVSYSFYMVKNRTDFLKVIGRESVPILYTNGNLKIKKDILPYVDESSFLYLDDENLDLVQTEMSLVLASEVDNTAYLQRFFNWRLDKKRKLYRLERDDQWDDQGFCYICRYLVEKNMK